MDRVRSLQDDDAGVLAERPGEEAVGRVNGVHTSSARLQQTIHKAADVTSEVTASQAGHVDLEMVEGGGEFLTAA